MIRITLVQHNFVDYSRYTEDAEQEIKRLGGLDVKFELVGIPKIPFELKEYLANTGQTISKILAYDFDKLAEHAKDYETAVVGFVLDQSEMSVEQRARFGGGLVQRGLPGQQQMFQMYGPVNPPSQRWERPLVHELVHALNFYLGIEDLVHDVEREEHSNFDASYRRLFARLIPHLPQLETPPVTVPNLPPAAEPPADNRMTRMQFYEMLAEAIMRHEGWGGPGSIVGGRFFPFGTPSYRNNNPGNLRSSPFQSGTSGGFAKLPDYQTGWEALIWDINLKFTGRSSTGLNGSSTLLRFFQVYAPAGDNNNPAAYVQAVVSDLRRRGLNITHLTRLWELLALTRERSFSEMFIAQREGSPLLALVNPRRGTRRHLTYRAWVEYFDKEDPVPVPAAWFDGLRRERDFSGGVNFGAAEDHDDVEPSFGSRPEDRPGHTPIGGVVAG